MTPFNGHEVGSNDMREESCVGSQSGTSQQEINGHYIHVGKYDNSISYIQYIYFIQLAMEYFIFRNVDFAFMAILDHLVSLLNEYQE